MPKKMTYLSFSITQLRYPFLSLSRKTNTAAAADQGTKKTSAASRNRRRLSVSCQLVVEENGSKQVELRVVWNSVGVWWRFSSPQNGHLSRTVTRWTRTNRCWTPRGVGTLRSRTGSDPSVARYWQKNGNNFLSLQTHTLSHDRDPVVTLIIIRRCIEKSSMVSERPFPSRLLQRSRGERLRNGTTSMSFFSLVFSLSFAVSRETVGVVEHENWIGA